jgi:hypothetical protein
VSGTKTALYRFRELGFDRTDVAVGDDCAATVLAAAERLRSGQLTIFGREVASPRQAHDWFVDSDIGVVAPNGGFAFDINAHNRAVVGNHKYLLGPSRLQHVSLLGAAYFLMGRDAFAELGAAQLRSWWAANRSLMGVHWTSGIEVRLRLVSFAWTGRLLAGWQGGGGLFREFPSCVPAKS